MNHRFFLAAAAIALTANPLQVYGIADPKSCLRGIVLINDRKEALTTEELQEVEGVWADEFEFSEEEGFVRSFLLPAFEKPFDEKTFRFLQDQISRYYQERGISVDVSIASVSEDAKVVQIAVEKKAKWLHAIVLHSDEENFLPSEELKGLVGIWVDGPDLPGGEELLQAFLEPALHLRPTEETLRYLKEQILAYYEQHDDLNWIVSSIQIDEANSVAQIAIRPQVAFVTAEIDTSATPESIAVSQEAPAVEEPQQVEWIDFCAEADENKETQETLPAEEFAVAEEAPIVEELVSEEAFAVAEEAPIVEEMASEEAFAVAEEASIVEEMVSEEAFAVAEEAPIVEELVAVEEPAVAEAQAAPICRVRSIVLLGHDNDILSRRSIRDLEDGVKVERIDLPGSAFSLECSLGQLLQEPFTEATLCAITDAIYRFYRDNDRPFVLVSVPAQLPESGVAQIVVQESRLGKVEVVGNRWTSSKRYSNYFGLKPGEPISQKKLRCDVNFMNRNPYRFVNVIYSPGEQEYTTDLTLEVSDRKPYFFYAGLDNFGVPTTGRQRVFAGFSWDQLFGLDQIFYYQYSTNYHVKRYHSNSFQYMAMLPWKSILNIYGGFSYVSADLTPAPVSNQGSNIQASIRYVAPFSEGRIFSQEWVAGFDLKNTNNTVEFSEMSPVFGQTVNVTQWILGYKCKYLDRRLEVDASLEGVFSPFEWLPNQSKADFASLRPNADAKWFYGIANCNIKYGLPHKFESEIRFRGHVSGNILLPSEQIGIGGPTTVRGYDERQYNGDSGAIINVELQSPRFSLFSSRKKNLTNQAYLLVFADGGVGFDNSAIPTVPQWDYLASTGVGLRYYLGTYFNARVDYGVKLHHQDAFTGGASMVQFSVSGSY